MEEKKRGRGRPPKPVEERTGFYFYTDEENAVVSYIKTDSAKIKNELFEKYLKIAFTRLIESILRKYFKDKISVAEFQMYFNNTMYHVLENMVSFNPNRNKKAYSYIGTIAKNFILTELINKRKVLLRDICYDDMSEDLNNNSELSCGIVNQYNADLNEVMIETSNRIKHMLSDQYKKKMTETELLVGRSIVNLMDNWDDMFIDLGSNKYNKSVILLYLKESTNLSTKELRSSMRKFKTTYFKTKESVFV